MKNYFFVKKIIITRGYYKISIPTSLANIWVSN